MDYVTFFNNKYLPQGMNLINSIESFCSDSKIHIFALDQITYDTIETLNFSSVVLYTLDDVMNSDLLNAKSNRNDREFIWTLTPFCIEKALQGINVADVTYIDADMAFIREPKKINNFILNHADKIILTPHYFDFEKFSNIEKHGYYCVQHMNFNKVLHKEPLNYWKQKVLQSCSEKPNDGVFGDQKYIEEIKNNYNELVEDYPNDSSFGAPWNMNSIIADKIEIFHFHSFCLLQANKFKLFNHSYKLCNNKIEAIYTNYMKMYLKNLDILKSLHIDHQIFCTDRSFKIKLLDFMNSKNIEVYI